MWGLVEADLHSEYGIDTGSTLLDERPWAWLKTRIAGLLAADTRTYRHFKPPDEKPPTPRRR